MSEVAEFNYIHRDKQHLFIADKINLNEMNDYNSYVFLKKIVLITSSTNPNHALFISGQHNFYLQKIF
jgi:hypothetical protein